jgi:hypothetical protein
MSRLRVRVVRASALAESTFVRLWQLRGELIDVEAGDDYAAFRSFFVGDEARVTLIFDRTSDEGIRGFLGWHLRPLDTDTGRVAIIDSDYFFVESALRGHPVMLGVVMGCYLHAALAYRTRRAAIVGHGYPASVISGARFSARVRFLQDPDVAAWEHAAMLQFTERFCGSAFDQHAGLVRMRTRPRESSRTPRDVRARELLARFESYNPNWTQGFGLPYLIHVSPGQILAGALRIARTAST